MYDYSAKIALLQIKNDENVGFWLIGLGMEALVRRTIIFALYEEQALTGRSNSFVYGVSITPYVN